MYRELEVPSRRTVSQQGRSFEYLMLHGIDKKTAFDITQEIFFGRVCRDGWNEEIREILNHANIPEWYIHSLEKIRGLSSRMHAITVLRHFCSCVGNAK